MGRSNKEARLTHSGYTIDTGHGGLKRNKVAPKSEESDSMKRAKAHQSKAAPAKTEGQQKADADMMEADAGWDTIGKAGASMVQTYKAKKAAK